MKKIKDIVHFETSDFETDHIARGSNLNVQSPYSATSSVNQTSLTYGSWVLAKYSEDSFRCGKVIGISYVDNKKIYEVKLTQGHNNQIIKTEVVKALSVV